MVNALKNLLTSKKFLTMVAGLVVSFAARKGLNLDETEVAGIVALFVAYIFAQGQADKGKEATKVNAVANAVSDETPRAQVEAIKNV